MLKKFSILIIVILFYGLVFGCSKSDDKLDISDFKTLYIGITEEETIEKFGEPDITGFGMYSNTYLLGDDRKVTLYFDTNSQLKLLRYWTSEDEYDDILSDNNDN